jgi:hypothetical protein
MKITIRSIGAILAMALLTNLSPAQGKPLKVFILAGQSNMTGMAKNSTFEHVKMFPETAKEYADLFNKDGSTVVLDDVYVSQWMGKEGGKLLAGYGGSEGQSFGPEFAFGVYMHKKLQEPFLIIKTAQGGKDLCYNFRSPSAGEWTPKPGHPDLEKNDAAPSLPLPAKLDLPDDWTPEKPYLLEKKFMGLKGFKGAQVEKVNGLSPLYVLQAPTDKIEGEPFLKGDLILGVDGSPLTDDPVRKWRKAIFSSMEIDGDWMINVTRWRKGKIETFDFDISDTIKGGRAALPAYLVEKKKSEAEKLQQRGGHYRDMMAHVTKVLGDIKSAHPAYDPAAGYEIAGFVWFQGWNDMVSEGSYPNRNKPRGYEQYTWLLEHFIRDVRKDLGAPNMPFVIGVMGIGGLEVEGPIGNFQLAQAAVAENPEFKGNVSAVQTGKYWDHELAAIVEKSDSIKSVGNQFKQEKGLSGTALKQAIAEYRAKIITPKEEELLKNGVSDGTFHYLGSAKIMSAIGKGFAEAMIVLQEKK